MHIRYRYEWRRMMYGSHEYYCALQDEWHLWRTGIAWLKGHYWTDYITHETHE